MYRNVISHFLRINPESVNPVISPHAPDTPATLYTEFGSLGLNSRDLTYAETFCLNPDVALSSFCPVRSKLANRLV